MLPPAARRFPANFNGVFGHKTSSGFVPTTGHFPARAGKAGMMSVIGPICRYVPCHTRHASLPARLPDAIRRAPVASSIAPRYACDLYPLLKVIAGPDGVDTNVRPQMVLQDPATVDLRKLRVFSWPNDGSHGLTTPVAKEINEVRGPLHTRRTGLKACSRACSRCALYDNVPRHNARRTATWWKWPGAARATAPSAPCRRCRRAAPCGSALSARSRRRPRGTLPAPGDCAWPPPD